MMFDANFFTKFNDLFKTSNANTEAYVDGDKIDLTTQDGHDKFVDTLNKLRNNSLFEVFGLSDFANKEIDSAIKAADNILSETHKQINAEESKEVAIPEKPSLSLPTEMKTKIGNITDKYLDTMIYPYYQVSAEKKADIRGALYEFASWIYAH